MIPLVSSNGLTTFRTGVLAAAFVAGLALSSWGAALEGAPSTATAAVLRERGISVIPKPALVEPGEGRFGFHSRVQIDTTAETSKIGRQCADAIRQITGLSLAVQSTGSQDDLPDTLALRLSGDLATYGEEGYDLRVSVNRMVLIAARPAGLFYGCQTLRQLISSRDAGGADLSKKTWSAPVVHIRDRPEFVWRGLMLDPARQFISKQGVLRYLELMAYHKLNRLHLHLTDTDGWRIEIKKYPRLTEVGAWAEVGEGIKLGGFYTQEDIREIVDYASDRWIMVIPEIETPSHAGAAMVAYPELNCFGTRTATFGWDPLCGSEFCPGNEKVFEFLGDVFTEVADLFPGPYLHVGGDEAEMRYWGECPKCQKRRKDENIRDMHGWFMERVKKLAEARGKQIVGWGGVAKGAVYTCWDSDGSSGWGAAKAGWDVVFSPGDSLYFNYNIDRTTLKSTYVFDPAPARAQLSPEARKHVLGVEACLWGEVLPEDHLDRRAFPRLLALAERGWGVKESDFDEFVERVKVHSIRLDAMGVRTGPAFGYPIVPTRPAKIQNGLPSMIYTQNQNDEDWRWTLTGIDKGQGYESLRPTHAFDGDLDTYYLSWGPRKDVDAFSVVLKAPALFDHVKVVTGLPNGDHILREGVVEVSPGYGRWRVVAQFRHGVAEAALDATPLVAVRIRSTINQPPFALLAVREFILEKDGVSTLRQLTPVERLRLPVEGKP